MDRNLKKPLVSSVNQTKGTCDDYVTLPKITGTAAATSALYIFPGSVHGGRIAEDYDLGTGNESQYLQTYSGDCRLDKRIFPALDRLVADAEAAIPGLKVGFLQLLPHLRRTSCFIC
jgi:hypothetical protein